MELRTHVHILKNAKWFIILFTLLVGVIALLFAVNQPVLYKAVVSFDVNVTDQPDTTEYQYGSYYDLKAAEIYTQNLMSWLKTPAVVAEIYTAAGSGYRIDSIDRFTNRFQAKQYGAQNFAVIFTDRNEAQAKKLADAVAQVIVERSKTSAVVNDQAPFDVQSLTPVVAKNTFNPWGVTAVGAIAGVLLSVVLVYLREYFRE